MTRSIWFCKAGNGKNAQPDVLHAMYNCITKLFISFHSRRQWQRQDIMSRARNGLLLTTMSSKISISNTNPWETSSYWNCSFMIPYTWGINLTDTDGQQRWVTHPIIWCASCPQTKTVSFLLGTITCPQRPFFIYFHLTSGSHTTAIRWHQMGHLTRVLVTL